MIGAYFHINFIGDWSCPLMKGIALPHNSYFSFTAIDDHRALIFGGNVGDRRVDSLYLIDFNTMVCSYFGVCILIQVNIHLYYCRLEL